ncbi:lysosomal alpha-mannosidase-like [Gigantopelta aegis]|uniref:lysosomal alpha-mannosidase-like n=1 Tax=Gigantopelta aegis TaxID=1735272 RepID=UPI001B888DA1|nr:lysosomal alpha-mannosidase-like [Gigantopelta aegis]
MRCHIRRVVYVVVAVVLIQLAVQLLFLMQQRRPATLTRHLLAAHNTGDESWGICNNKRCNPVKADMLNVHLIAHSHDDVGWLKTVEEYYTGRHTIPYSKSFVYGKECIACILKSVIPQLLANPERRFIFIEMAFFSRFWNESDTKTRANIVKLIRERRLEFATGGWCMSDAATTYYNDIIDQHTLGFNFINTHFGKCAQSNIAWHVDQFGHSREHSSIFAQMGFDAIFLGRISDQDRNNRKVDQNMEHIWNASPRNLEDRASLFTHVNHEGYYAPKYFLMEGWNEDHILLQKAEYVDSFLNVVNKIATFYKTNHIQIEMGSDFAYSKAHEWFSNLDDLIQFANERQATGSKVNLLYSTPSCYLHYVHAANFTWTEKNDDYFPYGTGWGEYWTGFYTSKGGLKKHVKDAGALLQACKQLNVFTSPHSGPDRVQTLKEGMAVLQHHDAITGTEKEAVVRDYNKLLSVGRHSCQSVVSDAYKTLSGDVHQPKQEFCPLLNISSCPPTEKYSKFIATMYNPLSRSVTSWIRLPVTKSEYRVVDPSGNVVPNEVLPLSESTFHIPERPTSSPKNDLIFKVQLPPLGFKSYVVESHSDAEAGSKPQFMPIYSNKMKISNNLLTVTIDKEWGTITQIANVESGIFINLKQELQYYEGMSAALKPSGAYIFNPRGVTAKSFHSSVITTVLKGKLVTEVHQNFSDWASQVIRLYDSTNYVEIEWTVGPIPVAEDYLGKEVIAMYKSDLNNHGKFYTDSNGREIMERRRNHRDTWVLEEHSPVASNYYPVTSKIFITDPTRNIQLTVLTDRCQGGSSIRDGEIELMLHRRTTRDDNLGVSEVLSEKGQDGQGLILRGKHYLFIDTIEKSARLHREMSQQIHLPPTLSFMPLRTSYEEWQKNHALSWSGLQNALPDNVQLLTLDTVPGGNSEVFLIRLEHTYEVDEDKQYSVPAEVSLQALFSPFQIDEIEELSLGANFQQSEVHRLKWRTTKGKVTPEHIGHVSHDPEASDGMTIVLRPMQIRTFHIYVSEPKKNFLFKFFK